MTDIGYARVSTREQNPARQHDAPTGAGCTRVFTDIASGTVYQHLDQNAAAC